MTVQEFLCRPNMLQQEIERKRRRIDFLRRQAERLTRLLQDVRIRSSPDPALMQALLAEAADEEQEIFRLEEERKQALVGIMLAISLVPDARHARLLELRYLDGAGWSEIAEYLFCGTDWVYKLHRAALESLPLPPEDPEESGG